MADKLTASEAVYGFAAFLTTREQGLTVGANYECSPVADLVAEFIEANGFDEPRDNYADNLVHPK